MGVEVDLHLALAVGWFGVALDHQRLMSLPAESIELGGVPAAALPGPARVLSTCYAIVLSRGDHDRLLRDLAQQLLVGNHSWNEAVALAGDGDVVLHTALRLAVEAIPPLGAHPAASAADPAPSNEAAAALRLAERAATEGWAADARSTLRALSWVDRTLFLAGLALPPRANRVARGRSLPGQLRRATTLIRRDHADAALDEGAGG